MSSRREDIGSKSIINVVRRLYGNGRSEEDYILISDYIDSLMTVASSFDIDAKSVMGDVMDKLEMILSDAYIRNHEEMEVMGNYNRVNSYLTSAKSRGYFMKRIGNVSDVIRNEGSGKKAKKRSVMPAVFFIVCLVLIMVMVVVVMFYGGGLGK